jgi:selenocysteine-specific translation elongation factor
LHDENLGKELGKKGTLSDIAMFNRKTDDEVFTFLSPVEDKLTAKSQIISAIDAAIIVFSQMTRELGETILLLDLMGIKEGISVASPYVPADKISAITGKTSLSSYRIEERDPIKLLELLKRMNPTRDSISPPIIVVDHSFSVKGVGEVALAFVKTGVVRKYDKLNLLPIGREVTVRSIQVQDEDMEIAEAGTRVGLAIKGATIDELERGTILTKSDQVRAASEFKLSFSKSPFYLDPLKEGAFHATVGMQTVPVTLSNPQTDSIVLKSAKSIAYSPQDTFLLLDLNAKKTRVMGRGTPQS